MSDPYRNHHFMFEHRRSNLNNAAPLERMHTAEIVIRGEIKGRLKGPDREALQTRAHAYACAQGWHRATVRMVSHES